MCKHYLQAWISIIFIFTNDAKLIKVIHVLLETIYYNPCGWHLESSRCKKKKKNHSNSRQLRAQEEHKQCQFAQIQKFTFKLQFSCLQSYRFTLDISSLPWTLAQTLVNFPLCLLHHFHKYISPIKTPSSHPSWLSRLSWRFCSVCLVNKQLKELTSLGVVKL